MNILFTLRSVYACEEHGEVDVSIGELLTNGALDIYEEIANRGFFDINHRRGRLILRATKFVGLIPLSDRVAIHVRPKVPIANLAYMICRAGMAPDALKNVMRTYATADKNVDAPEVLYRDAFLRALGALEKQGLLKQYVREINERDWKGSVLVSQSVNRYYARGIRYKHCFQQTRITADNTANRILKRYAQPMLNSLQSQATRETYDQLQSIRNVLSMLSTVDETKLSYVDVLNAPVTIIRGLPSSHAYYETPLWLAYLIAAQSGISIEELGPVKLESIVVDMSVVFENYVRKVCQDVAAEIFRCDVLDGNKEPLNLFSDGQSHTIKPDIIFQRSGQIIAIADAKYKPRLSEANRYEVLAYCEATRAKHAAFILPLLSGSSSFETIGRTQNYSLGIVRINLSNPDIEAEERNFTKNLSRLLSV